jgi:hypothetical protein
MEKTINELEVDLKNLASAKPTSDEDISKWIDQLNLTFEQTVETLANIFDNKTFENEINKNI